MPSDPDLIVVRVTVPHDGLRRNEKAVLVYTADVERRLQKGLLVPWDQPDD